MTMTGTFFFRGNIGVIDMTEKFEESVDSEEAWELTKQFMDYTSDKYSVKLKTLENKTYTYPLSGIDLLNEDGYTFIVSFLDNKIVGLTVTNDTRGKWSRRKIVANKELNERISRL